ncbi:carbonic anhydrase [Candidatus Zixiibacteriota bacterium]
MRQCDNLILHCMDYRIQHVIGEWLKAEDLQGNIDVVSFAGACKNADFALQNIAIGLEKHGVHRVFLTQHDDCAAYGGQAAFASRDAERKLLLAEMMALKGHILHNYPQVHVIPLYIKQLDGSWEIIEV